MRITACLSLVRGVRAMFGLYSGKDDAVKPIFYRRIKERQEAEEWLAVYRLMYPLEEFHIVTVH
jgi:hypothetical protein